MNIDDIDSELIVLINRPESTEGEYKCEHCTNEKFNLFCQECVQKHYTNFDDWLEDYLATTNTELVIPDELKNDEEDRIIAT
jgi:hypothetical protein